MSTLQQILRYLYESGDLYNSLISSLIILIVGSISTLLATSISKRTLFQITSRTRNITDDFIGKTIIRLIKPVGILITFAMSWLTLPIPSGLDNFVIGSIKLLVLIIIVRAVNKIAIKISINWCQTLEDKAISSMIESFVPMVRSIIWTIALVFYLQNMGVQMAALWALLSAGGIGAGLALKEPVQEFFEYITILLDKPFQKGQFINVDNVWASVEQIGVRSTRLRSLSGETIVMSNSKLTSSTIANYAEMNRRRIVHKIGVVYGTNHKTMKEIPSILEFIVSETEDAEFDRASFTDFGDYSLNIEFVYFVPTNNYKRAMLAQQKINLLIMKTFEAKSIDFAFPTNTVHVRND